MPAAACPGQRAGPQTAARSACGWPAWCAGSAAGATVLQGKTAAGSSRCGGRSSRAERVRRTLPLPVVRKHI